MTNFGESEHRQLCKKKLIVIGASYLQLPLILKAHQMEIETHAFAWEEGAVAKHYADFFYPISIVEKETILQRAKEIRPNGVISIASDLATVTVNYLANELQLTGNSMEVTERTTNKYLMRRELFESGLPCPRFLLVRQAAEIRQSELDLPVIVKPIDRSGSRGVTKVDHVSELAGAIERAVSESLQKQAIIEEFIVGREISVEAISWQGEHHFLAITDKVTTGAPYFVETEHHQPSEISPHVTDNVLRTVERALACLGIRNGASHSELLITPSHEVFIVEIGARMGGDLIGSHLVQLSTGYDFLRGVIEAAVGEFHSVKKGSENCAGVYYLSALAGRVTRIIDQTSRYPEIVGKDIFVEVGDIVSQMRQSGNRIGYYLYQAVERFTVRQPPILVMTDTQQRSHD